MSAFKAFRFSGRLTVTVAIPPSASTFTYSSAMLRLCFRVIDFDPLDHGLSALRPYPAPPPRPVGFHRNISALHCGSPPALPRECVIQTPAVPIDPDQPAMRASGLAAAR